MIHKSHTHTHMHTHTHTHTHTRALSCIYLYVFFSPCLTSFDILYSNLFGVLLYSQVWFSLSVCVGVIQFVMCLSVSASILVHARYRYHREKKRKKKKDCQFKVWANTLAVFILLKGK